MMAVAALRDQWQADRKIRQQEHVRRQQAVQANLQGYRHVRQADARRTAAKLQEFNAELKEVVAEQRAENRQAMQDVQKYVAELQEFTQETLTEYQRERVVKGQQQNQKLAQYVDALGDSVSEYLDDISQKRQAVEAENRARRQRDRQALHNDHMAYKRERQSFRRNLRQSVWGDVPAWTGSHASPAADATPKTTAGPSTTNGHPSNVTPENAIYTYLRTHNSGARLTEIESHLGINRLETVDALRSLIQQELVVQKNKTYHIHEGSAL